MTAGSSGPTVREEKPADVEPIRRVIFEAFGQPQEWQLVDSLRRHDSVIASLVAEIDGGVAGHVLFSPVRLESEAGTFDGAGLAPLSVLPGLQRGGIGSALVTAGLSFLRSQGCMFCVVLGDPGYYSRFGFIAARTLDIHCRWEVPEDAFMILELRTGSLAGARGMVEYDSLFDDLETVSSATS